MAQDTKTYIISLIVNSLPAEVLELSFESRKFNTTIEQRIISEIIEGPILLDTNLLGGKRRDIFINPAWEMNLDLESDWNATSNGVQSSFYKIPPEAREDRNIASVLGITPAMSSTMPGASSVNGSGGYGNTATGMLGQMLNTRTFGQYPTLPQVTLEGTNIIRFNPRLQTGGIAVSVMLEYDSEFLNMEASAIMALAELCLCATQRYIGNKLRVKIDESEIVAGMEVGVIKDIVNECIQKGEQYNELKKKFVGATRYDKRAISRIIHFGL
jgi:hypothetical protein